MDIDNLYLDNMGHYQLHRLGEGGGGTAKTHDILKLTKNLIIFKGGGVLKKGDMGDDGSNCVKTNWLGLPFSEKDRGLHPIFTMNFAIDKH